MSNIIKFPGNKNEVPDMEEYEDVLPNVIFREATQNLVCRVAQDYKDLSYIINLAVVEFTEREYDRLLKTGSYTKEEASFKAIELITDMLQASLNGLNTNL